MKPIPLEACMLQLVVIVDNYCLVRPADSLQMDAQYNCNGFDSCLLGVNDCPLITLELI